jgi:hypothetical protein
MGKYGAIFPEPLHQLLKGLMARGLENLMTIIKEYGGAQAVRLFDFRIQSLNPTRNSERRAFPMATFPRGLSALTKIFGQEYPSALLQAMTVLAGDFQGDLLDRETAATIVEAFDQLYRFWLYLEAESVPKVDIVSGSFQSRVIR